MINRIFNRRNKDTRVSLIAELVLHAQFFAEDLLAHTDADGSDLNELIVRDELETLFKREHGRGSELQRVVRA
jgi:hypothetical protein